MKRLLLNLLPILLAADIAMADDNWSTSFHGKPYVKQTTSSEKGRPLYPLEEVAQFFLSQNPSHTRQYFDLMMEKESFETLTRDDCFGTFWEYELASSKGYSSSFSHIVCRDRAVSLDSYKRWYQSHKQSAIKVIGSSSENSSDEVADFFLSHHPGYTRNYFYRSVREDACFLPLWESALARSKGRSTSFDHQRCKLGGETKTVLSKSQFSGGTDHPPSVRFFIAETGKTAEDYRKLPSWAKDQWAVWHSQGSTASAPVYTRQTYNESKSKEKGGSALERFLWGNIAREIDCKIGECAERERFLRDVEAAAARGAARGSRTNSRRYYNSKTRPVPQNNSPQPLRTGPYCTGPYAGDCD